jgi:hypothetical protein
MEPLLENTLLYIDLTLILKLKGPALIVFMTLIVLVKKKFQ